MNPQVDNSNFCPRAQVLSIPSFLFWANPDNLIAFEQIRVDGKIVIYDWYHDRSIEELEPDTKIGELLRVRRGFCPF